jgi:hypothetical protein
MTIVAAGMKAKQVTLTFGTRTESLPPMQAMHLAEEMVRLAYTCVNGVEPPSGRSLVAAEVRRRYRGEIRDELIANGLTALRILRVEGKDDEGLVEALADHLLARIK